MKKRIVVGSICRPKEKGENSSNYLKLRGETLNELIAFLRKADKKKGVFLFLETKNKQLKSLENAIKNGKLSEDYGEKIKERIEKIPDYVIAEVILLKE